MFHVVTVDHFGREKEIGEWLSGQLAVDEVRAQERTRGQALREILILDDAGNLLYSKLDLELESRLKEHA